MNDKLCLRCDWSGRTRDRDCPSCGARLFTAPGATSTEQPRRARTRRTRHERDEPLVERSAAASREERGTRPALPGWLPVVAVLALAAAVVVFVQQHTPAPAEPVAGLSGRLVYASSPVRGLSQLWVWDLSTNTLQPGPTVREPVELVDASEVRPGWVGVTSALPHGERGSLIRFLTPSDLPDTLVTGNLVTWSAGGATVTSASLRGDPCGRLRVRSYVLTVEEHSLRLGMSFCGRLVSLGRDISTPYLSLVAQRAPSPSIAEVGTDALHGLVRGFVALSVSRAGDLLVVRASKGYEVGSAPPRDLALVYGAPRPRHPIPYGTPGHALVAERVLCWDEGATRAFILGSVDGVRGVYAIDIGPGTDPKVPVLLTATDAVHVAATATSGADVIVALDGHLVAIRDGGLVPLDLPDGAAPVVGPILWTRSLGYSGP